MNLLTRSLSSNATAAPTSQPSRSGHPRNALGTKPSHQSSYAQQQMLFHMNDSGPQEGPFAMTDRLGARKKQPPPHHGPGNMGPPSGSGGGPGGYQPYDLLPPNTGPGFDYFE